MKRYFFIACMLCSLASCKNSWDDDDKKTFYQSCMEAAKADNHPEDKAKPYCDCLMEKMMTKYPNESDALEHMDSVITDPSVQQCKDMLK